MSATAEKFARILPRLLRFRDAPFYVGMDRNRFNVEVRPHLTTIPIGQQGIAFDRLELDAWVDQYKSRNGRPSRTTGGLTWDDARRQDSSSVAGSGMSTSASAGGEFAKALAQLGWKKPSGSREADRAGPPGAGVWSKADTDL